MISAVNQDFHQITNSNQTDQKHLNKHQWDENWKDRNIFDKHVFNVYRVPSANMEELGFTAYTAASHQGAIQALWLHSWIKWLDKMTNVWLCECLSDWLNNLHDDASHWVKAK